MVTGGVDTHGDTHNAAVIDAVGRLLGTEQFPATRPGYRRCWPGCARHRRGWSRVGVEGTGAYGAGLARTARPRACGWSRSTGPTARPAGRRASPTRSTPYAAAGRGLAGARRGTPKRRDGLVEAIRALRVARRSAVKARTQTINQINALIVTAPDRLRAQLRGLHDRQLIATCARLRPGRRPRPTRPPRPSARCVLARRHQTSTPRSPTSTPTSTRSSPQAAPSPARTARRRHRRRRPAAGHRRRQPRPAALRSRVRPALRRRPDPRLLRPHQPPPPQPRRRPPRQRRPLHASSCPPALRPPHPRLRRTPHQRRPIQERDHPLPQTLHRPRDLPRPRPHTSAPA